MRSNILSVLLCGVAALSLAACDEEPVVETAPVPGAVTVEAADELPACCPTSIGAEGTAAAAKVASEVCEDVCDPSDCEIDEACEEIQECDETGQCPSEKTPE